MCLITERIAPRHPMWRKDAASHFQRYRFAGPFVSGRRVLDAGCGVGYGSKMLAEFGAIEVVAVDIAEEALSTARSSFAHPVVHFVQDDLESLATQNSRFDIIVALESFEHLQRPGDFLRRAAELLCPSGVLICSTPRGAGANSGHKPENQYHVAEYTAAEFATLLAIHFSDIKILGQHWTAAARGLTVLWSNPFMRMGRLLQRIRGRRVGELFVSPELLATEGDLVISEANYDLAWTLIGVCRGPK